MLIKICGIKNIESAKVAVDAGADLLGFIFVPDSKRFVKTDVVKEIVDSVGGRVKTVGVFRDQTIDEINRISEFLNLDFVQMHGNTTVDDVSKINTKVIKAYNLPSDFDVEEVKERMSKYKVDFFLLDREIQGEGRHLNMQKVSNLCKTFPVIISGGLNLQIVADVIKTTRPEGVDVSSGVETGGEKDSYKIAKFIQVIREREVK